VNASPACAAKSSSIRHTPEAIRTVRGVGYMFVPPTE
jgi:DNA-binding response OmpR family regulator